MKANRTASHEAIRHALSLYVRTESSQPGKGLAQVRFQRSGICPSRFTGAFFHMKFKSDGKRTTEYILCRLHSGSIVFRSNDFRMTFKRNDWFVWHFGWDVELITEGCVLMGYLLPCGNEWLNCSEAEGHRRLDEVGGILSHRLIERILQQSGGVEFLARSILGIRNVCFQRRHRIALSLLRNIQNGDLHAKQVAIDIGISDAAVSKSEAYPSMSVSAFLKEHRHIRLQAH